MKFTVEPQVSNEDGTIWQAVQPAETVDAGSPEEAAQSVWVFDAVDPEDDGVGAGEHRVLVWQGEDADTGSEPVFTYSES